ncbi:MAG: hypothetical protein U0168_06170 [Nannocystaceae bacterium]
MNAANGAQDERAALVLDPADLPPAIGDGHDVAHFDADEGAQR